MPAWRVEVLRGFDKIGGNKKKRPTLSSNFSTTGVGVGTVTTREGCGCGFVNHIIKPMYKGMKLLSDKVKSASAMPTVAPMVVPTMAKQDVHKEVVLTEPKFEPEPQVMTKQSSEISAIPPGPAVVASTEHTAAIGK